MLRRLLESFTATHVTILASVAMLGSGAAVAAVAYQPVAIVNPSTGATAYVSPGKLLYVYDQIAGYRNNPGNAVTITFSNSGTQCEPSQDYKIPAGKALMITAITGYFQGTTADNKAGYNIYTSARCFGGLLSVSRTSVTSTSFAGPVSVDFGSGMPVPSGSTISMYSVNNIGYTYLHGYLLPSGAIPAAGSPDAAYQGKEVSAADVAAKERRLNEAH